VVRGCIGTELEDAHCGSRDGRFLQENEEKASVGVF